MLKVVKFEDFVKDGWVCDVDDLLDNVDSSGLYLLKLESDCVLRSIEKLDSVVGMDIVDSIEGEDWVIVDNVEWGCVFDGEIWNIEVG
jgi:hypothetical protein